MKITKTRKEEFNSMIDTLYKLFPDICKTKGIFPKGIYDRLEFDVNFLNSNNVADNSIDPNANITNQNMVTMFNEDRKPEDKYNSKMCLYSAMCDDWGENDANLYLIDSVVGNLYEHDEHSSAFFPYCFAFSLKPIAERGLFFLNDKHYPPKHWDSFNRHVIELISYASNNLAGAVGIPDYLLYAYYFYKEDKKLFNDDTNEYLFRQNVQNFIYALNQPYVRSGIQSAFTNITIFDRMHFLELFNGKTFPNGEDIIDHEVGFFEFQQKFLDEIIDIKAKSFKTFPVISASLLWDKEENRYEDQETARMVVRHNLLDHHSINVMSMDKVAGMASCCRMTNYREDLTDEVFNSIGGTSINVGGSKVVTIPFVRLALSAMISNKNNNIDDVRNSFKNSVLDKVEMIHKFHYSHRRLLKQHQDNGLLPLLGTDLMSLDDMFAIVGISGVYEAMKLLGFVTYSDGRGYHYKKEGIEFIKNLFKTISKINDTTKLRYGFTSNIEQIPGESATVKLCKMDKIFFDKMDLEDKLRQIDIDINELKKILSDETYIYGNQWIPLKEEADLSDRISTSAELDTHCGGGAMLHLNLNNKFTSLDDAFKFYEGISRAGVIYFSVIEAISICKEDHSFSGDMCPFCGGEKTSEAIKVVGYCVKTQSFSKARRKEFNNRKFYNIKD